MCRAFFLILESQVRHTLIRLIEKLCPAKLLQLLSGVNKFRKVVQTETLNCHYKINLSSWFVCPWCVQLQFSFISTVYCTISKLFAILPARQEKFLGHLSSLCASRSRDVLVYKIFLRGRIKTKILESDTYPRGFIHIENRHTTHHRSCSLSQLNQTWQIRRTTLRLVPERRNTRINRPEIPAFSAKMTIPLPYIHIV